MFIRDMTAPVKLGLKHKSKDTTGKDWQADQLSESQTSVMKHHQFENCNYCKVLYGKWAEQFAHSPYKTL